MNKNIFFIANILTSLTLNASECLEKRQASWHEIKVKYNIKSDHILSIARSKTYIPDQFKEVTGYAAELKISDDDSSAPEHMHTREHGPAGTKRRFLVCQLSRAARSNIYNIDSVRIVDRFYPSSKHIFIEKACGAELHNIFVTTKVLAHVSGIVPKYKAFTYLKTLHELHVAEITANIKAKEVCKQRLQTMDGEVKFKFPSECLRTIHELLGAEAETDKIAIYFRGKQPICIPVHEI